MNTLTPALCCQVTKKQVQHWQGLSHADRLAHSHYWRAKRLNDGQPNGFWTGAAWERLCARAGWRCFWCCCPTNVLVPDHLVPLARGGSNELTNIVPSCAECNLSRGANPVWDWLTFEEFLRRYRRLHPRASEERFGPADEDEQAA